jgi:hypothetical protein
MIERHIYHSILNGLKVFPSILITGARQVGKSTLAKMLSQGDWPASYYSLDDPIIMDLAQRDPDGFVHRSTKPMVIDEIQKVPDLMRALKRNIDLDRKNGQFLLTGSANIMTLKTVSESLAGRIGLYQLNPFSWAELEKKPATNIIDRLFTEKDPKKVLNQLFNRSSTDYIERLMERVLIGGYPEPCLNISRENLPLWFENYRETYINRDIRDLANIEYIHHFYRLLNILAYRSGQLINYADISRDLELPLSTLRRYATMLEQTYQIQILYPYYINIGKRLVKTPKIYITDTGMLNHLNNFSTWDDIERSGKLGSVVETWAANEITKLISVSHRKAHIYFIRLYTGQEIDFILESGINIVAIEVKWAQKISGQEIDKMRNLVDFFGDRLKVAIILYPGLDYIDLGSKLCLIPFSFFYGLDFTVGEKH